MAYWLLKLLGIKAENGAFITHPGFALRGAFPIPLIILIGVLLAVATL